MSDSEPDVPPPPKEKRKCTDKQLENLRAGMAKLKSKRETLAKEKEEFEAKKSKGEVPPDAPKPKFVPEPKKAKVVKVAAEPPPPQVIQVERKKRVEKSKIEVNEVKSELAALRTELAAMKKPAEVVVKEGEKPVDRIVEKTKVLSGSELLNSIFFK